MATSSAALKRQVERILDQSLKSEAIEVVVQMESGRSKSSPLLEAAGVALSRRRFSMTARDLLPVPYEGRKRISKREMQETASTRTLLGRRTGEAFEISSIRASGAGTLDVLLRSVIVQEALSRASKPARKGEPDIPTPLPFWTSRSMPLRLRSDELWKLTSEVESIKSVHLNRRLSLPAVMETQPLRLETEEIGISTWGLDKVKALSAWGALGARGKGVTIGLLDTGIDDSHPDLKGKLAAWAEFDRMGRPVVGSKPHDSDEHGTHCAGTLVGGDTSGRAIGMAPEAKIAAALVLNGKHGGTDAQILRAIDWAVEQEVDLISLSLGGLVMEPETPSTYTEAILTCIKAGIPVIAAIGNEGEQTSGSPGSDLFALSVGATDHQDRAAGFSGGRTQIIRENDYIAPEHLPLAYSKPELSAPGVAVYSTVPGGGYKAFNGTSMATPHVAGAIALLLSATDIRAKETGDRRAFTIQDLIVGSVEDLGEAGQDHRFGFGRLDVLRAIDFARQRGY